jgi:hypothetical protein
VKRFAGVGALVAITLGLAAWLAGPRATPAHAGTPAWPPPPTRSSVLAHGGRVRCTATVRSQVQVGQTVSVKFAVHNLSGRGVKVLFDPDFVLKAADGTSYDPGQLSFGFPRPPILPTKLRAGATIRGAVDVAIRWRGPFQITPTCLGRKLPALRVGVLNAWPGPDRSTAVAQVVAAAGHLLDHCRPQTSGVPVQGQIYPPSGTAPPLDAQCSVSITAAGPFLTAQVLVLTPPGLTGVQVYQPYETFWQTSPLGVPGPAAAPYEAVAWEFVVTRQHAIPVAATSVAATKESSKGTIPFFDWNSNGGQPGGSGSCGGTGFAWGGTGPEVEFISACSA